MSALRLALYTWLAILSGFIVAEGLGRGVIWAIHGVPGKTYGIYRSDPVLGATFRENSYNLLKQFNNLGFQSDTDISVGRRSEGLRIIAYGGSTTFCFNLSMEESWPRRLQDLLQIGRSDRVIVLNAGDVALSLSHSYARVRKDLNLVKPDFVLIYSGFNEMRNAYRLQSEGVDLANAVANGDTGLFNQSEIQFDPLFRNSIVYKAWIAWIFNPYVAPLLVALNRLGAVHPPQVTEAAAFEDAVLQHYLGTLNAFIGEIKRAGARPIFVIQVANRDRPDLALRASFSSLGADVARNAGAIVVDGRDILEDGGGDERLFIETGYHLSAEGADRLARMIADKVDWPDEDRSE